MLIRMSQMFSAVLRILPLATTSTTAATPPMSEVRTRMPSQFAQPTIAPTAAISFTSPAPEGHPQTQGFEKKSVQADPQQNTGNREPVRHPPIPKIEHGGGDHH